MELMQKYPIAVDLSAWRTSNTGPQMVMQLLSGHDHISDVAWTALICEQALSSIQRVADFHSIHS